jgi:hypothetical protein
MQMLTFRDLESLYQQCSEAHDQPSKERSLQSQSICAPKRLTKSQDQVYTQTTHLHFLQALMRWNLSIHRKYSLLLRSQFLQKCGASAIKVFQPLLGQKTLTPFGSPFLPNLNGSIWINDRDKCSER